MTYYELLENYLYEKATSEFYDESQLETLVDEGFVISHEPDTYDYTLIKSLSESKIVVKYEGEYSSPEFMILNGSRDVTHEEVGSISDIDEFLAKDYLAELAAEKERASKLITVGSLEKILDKYDEEKGISAKNGTVTINNKQIAFYSDVSSVRSSLNSLQSSVNTTLNKKAEKTHTHKAADITDMPNFVKTVNGENPDTDGNINIDADSVVEVTELPAEAEKKVYLKPKVSETSVSINCSSMESILSGIASWLTGKKKTIKSVYDFRDCVDEILPKRGDVQKNLDKSYQDLYTITLSRPLYVANKTYTKISIGIDYTMEKNFKAGEKFADSKTVFETNGKNYYDANYSSPHKRGEKIVYSDWYKLAWVNIESGSDTMRFYSIEGLTEPYLKYNLKYADYGMVLYNGKIYFTSTFIVPVIIPFTPPSMRIGDDATYPAKVSIRDVQVATQETVAALESKVSAQKTDLQAKIDAINAILTKNNIS